MKINRLFKTLTTVAIMLSDLFQFRAYAACANCVVQSQTVNATKSKHAFEEFVSSGDTNEVKVFLKRRGVFVEATNNQTTNDVTPQYYCGTGNGGVTTNSSSTVRDITVTETQTTTVSDPAVQTTVTGSHSINYSLTELGLRQYPVSCDCPGSLLIRTNYNDQTSETGSILQQGGSNVFRIQGTYSSQTKFSTYRWYCGDPGVGATNVSVNQSYTNFVEVDAFNFGSPSPNAPTVETYNHRKWVNGSLTTEVFLENEYTTSMLRSQAISALPSFSGTWEGGASTASYIQSDKKRTASVQKTKIRFRILGSAGEKFKVWFRKLKISYTGAMLSNTLESIDVTGAGDLIPVYSSEINEDVPSTPQVVSFHYVGITRADEDAPSEEGGSAPGSGGLASGGAGGGSGASGASGGCSTCGNSGPTTGSSSGGNGPANGPALQFNVSRGYGSGGGAAGTVGFDQITPSWSQYSPSNLRFSSNSESDFRYSSGTIAQILDRQSLVDIQILTTNSYRLRFFRPQQIASTNGALITVTNGSQPHTIWTVSNPATNSFSSIQVAVTNINGTSHQYLANFTNNASSATSGWIVSSPGNLYETTLVTGFEAVEIEGSPVKLRTERESVRGLPSGAEARVTLRKYRNFSWGEGLVEESFGTGTEAKTNSFDYSDDSGMTSSGAPLKSKLLWDGTWEVRTYDVVGRLEIVYTGHEDGGPDLAGNYRATRYEYSGGDPADSLTQAPDMPRIVTEYIGPTAVRKTFHAYLAHEHREIVCRDPYGAYNSVGALVTITKYIASGINQGKVDRVIRPDGTIVLYGYAGSSTAPVETVAVGQPDGSATTAVRVLNGTLTTTTFGSLGQVDSRIEQWLSLGATNQIIASVVNSLPDEFDRPTKTTFLDGTYIERTFGCCGLSVVIDREGILTEYLYDAANRRTATRRLGITTTNLLDAAGAILETRRIGSDSSIHVQWQGLFDSSGFLYRSTNAFGGVTTYTESTDGSGRRVKSTVQPDGGTRIETFHRDGTMFQLTGTAVQGLEAHSTAEYVEIDGNGTYLYAEKQETQPLDSLGSPTSERSVSYTDGRGLTLRRENAAGQIRWTQVNTSGQVVEEVDEDGVTNRISYNFKGEVDYSGIDSDGSGSLTASSLDRIKYSLSYVTNVSGVAYRYSFRQEFPTNNSAAVLTTAESWATLDGFQTWTVAFGLTNRTVTSINRGTQTRTVTRYNPDGSYTVDVFVSGRPSTSTRYDSASAQIGKTTYGYDFHGRRASSTDARNGATTLAYNSADLIVSLTSPVPGNGDPNQVTTSQYDSSGRAWKVIQPDGTSTTNEFFPTGQLKKTYGSRTYPVEYTYDSVGRMATMKTWRDFVGNSGAATTAWTYDNTGRMTAKTYADSSAIAYTYTPAGRLKSRTWARNSTTTYFYDFEDVSPTRRNGDLVQIAYDDGVTPLVRYGIDRRGRRTSVAQWSPDGSTLLNTASQTLQPSGVMTSESHSGGPLNNMSVAFAYDSLLRRTNLTARQTGSSVVLSTRYGYDLASRLNLVGDSTNDVSYARLGNSDMIGTVTHKQGANTRLATARSYDYLNRLNSTFSTPSSSGQPVFGSAYVYNAANQRKRQGLGDGSYWMYEYDALGQVVAGRRYWGDGTPVAGQQFEYAFDDIGNRKNTKAGGDAAGANVRQATYSVNSLNLYTSRSNPRYLEVQGSARSTGTVQVDGSTTGVIRQGEYFRKELGAIGGTGALWQSVTVGLSGGTNTGSKSLFLPPATESYTYDADGNLTADGQWTYAWDAENRLIEIASKLSAGVPLSPTTLARRITYRYDGQSRQLERVEFTWNTGTAAWNTTPAATTRYLYDGWNCVAEFSVSGATVTHQRSYLWGLDMSGSMAGAGGVGGLLAIYQGPMSGPAVHYTAYDGNGNVIGLVKAADGNVSARYEYGPFGEPLRGTGEAIAAANPWRFSTKRADPVTTLVHYEYRVYNPTTGRWLGRDPIGERHSLGLLVFLSNQSLSSIDRFGLLDLRDGSTFTPTGDGHHIIPKHLWNCLGFSQDAAEFLDSSEARIPVSYHHDRTRHNIYDNNVAEEIERFMKSEKGKSLLKGCGKNCILDRNAAQEILNHVKSSQNQYVRTFLDNVGKSKEELARAMDALPTSMAQRCSKVFSWCAKAGKCLAVAAPFLGHASAQQRAEAAVEAGHSVSAGVLLYAVEQISPISPSEVRDTVREMKSEFDECGNRIGERRFGRLLD